MKVKKRRKKEVEGMVTELQGFRVTTFLAYSRQPTGDNR